jgi:predicted RNase H-like HicB family nuclease
MHVWWSQEDGAWLVEVPDLPGAMADGATPAEAIANVQDTIRLWIELAREHGRTVPEPRDIGGPHPP